MPLNGNEKYNLTKQGLFGLRILILFACENINVYTIKKNLYCLVFSFEFIEWTLTIRCTCAELSFWYMPSKLIVWKGQNPCVCCIQTADNFLMQYAMEFISLRFPFFHNMRRCIGKIDVVLFARCIYHPIRLYIVHSINTFYLRYNIQVIRVYLINFTWIQYNIRRFSEFSSK